MGNNCIVGSGAVVSGCIPDNSICGGVPCKIICKTSEWAIKHIEAGDIVDVDIDRIRKECEEKKMTDLTIIILTKMKNRI